MSLLKRLLIFAVSCVVFGASWLRDLLRRLAGKPSRGSCVVLYYHAIPEQYRARFEGQMNDVLRFAQPIIAARRTPLEAGKRYAAVTFDDAYESVRLYALPSLRAKGIPSTIFVVPAMCGRTASLSDLSTESVAQREVMSAETVRHLSGELVMIGSHTLTHPYLTKLSREDAAYELAESRRVLEQLVQKPVRLFSFPYGACSEELFSLCSEVGYERVFTTVPQPAFRQPDEFVTGRVRVDPTDWPMEFRLKLLGAYNWLPLAFALKRRILA